MNKYHIEFAKVKKKVLERDNWSCQLLSDFVAFGPYGHFGTLTVDHIHRRSTGGTNEMRNLITLCEGHHDYVEGLPQQEKSNFLYSLLEARYQYAYE